MIKKLIAAVAVVLVLGGVAFYFLVIKDDPAPELSIDTPAGSSDGPTTTAADAGSTVSVDGAWKIDTTATDNAVGLRIKEKFIGGAAEHTAVGRTATVTGDITIAGTKVTAGSFTANLADLEFTDSPPGLNVASRKKAIANAGLETATFPETSFKITSPIDLGKIPTAGTKITTTATGDLTLHGVTKSVTFKVDGVIENGRIVIATTDPVDIKLADYSMAPPAFGPVADVSDTGKFEFKLTLTKG